MTELVKPNLSNPVHLLAFGFGSGLLPKAPGTAGTIAAILPWLWLSQQSLTTYLTVLLVAIIIGVYLCGKTSRDMGVHDHSGIVWDEFCGLWLTMVAVPATWQWLLLGFVLFRFFDIIKPWPINWLDKKIPGGLGIMVDDLLAAVYSWLILQLLLVYF
jgi:phosphatidylglycerophosphatase A